MSRVEPARARGTAGLHRFANPARFQRLSARLLPWTAALALLLIVVGLYLALFVAPEDARQGQSARIMYVHVPSAWMAMFCYSFMAVASAVGLIWRHPLADLAAKATAPIGALFNFTALVTGSLWGKPTWGTYWVWDARLTSVLILFFLYLGYMALWQAIDDRAKAARAAAILALVGAVNVPIIKFSVDWWNTLHQSASVLVLGGPKIYPTMLWPLLVMALGFTLYFAAVLMVRLRAELNERRARVLRHRLLGGA